MNKLSANISTGNITELDELIYTGTKQLCDKIDVALRNLNKNTKLGWEIRLEGQVKKLQQVKVLRKEKYANIYWDEKKQNKTAIKSDNATSKFKIKKIILE